MQSPTTNVGPINSAVLTFIGHKKPDKHPDKESKYINNACNEKFHQFSSVANRSV